MQIGCLKEQMAYKKIEVARKIKIYALYSRKL